MRRSFCSFLLATLALSSVAEGAEWHKPPATSPWSAPVSSASGASLDARAIAESYFAAEQARLSLQGVRMVATRTLSAPSHHTVRFVQSHQGVPVIGGQAAVRVGADGQVRASVLELRRDLTVSTVPDVDAEAAKTLVADSVGGVPATMRTSLAVWPDDRGGRLAWQVDVPSIEGGRRALVDAHGGEVFQWRPLGVHALGRVYPISSVVTPATQDLDLLNLVPSTPQVLTGHGGGLVVTNYVSGNFQMSNYVVEQALNPNSGEDFLFDPPANSNDTTDPFAQVMVYYHLTRMRDFFESRLGLDMSAASWDLVAVANMLDNGQPYNNAFFSQMGLQGDFAAPNLIGIGQGAIDFALDSDVFNHEFTHYATHNAVNFNAGQLHSTTYGLSPFSGGIDEGLSDYFACTLNDDSTLGEASLALLGAARDLTDTSKQCPQDVVGEVHEDGEIIASATWTLREQFGADIADGLVWNAVTLLTYGATFGDFGRALQQSADDLLMAGTITQADRDFVDATIAARGLDECDALLPLRKDEPRTVSLFGLDILTQIFGGSCADLKAFGAELQSIFHFEVTPEPGDEAVRVKVDLAPVGSGALSWRIYAAIDDNVGFQAMQIFPTVSTFDYAVEGLTGTSGEIVIDENSDPPFDPARRYSFVVVHQNCPVVGATISTDADTGMGGTGGGGGGGTGGEGGAPIVAPPPAAPQVVDGGCGCRVAGESPESTWPAWLALGLAAVAWRRRRTA